MYAVTALFFESWKVEPWESTKEVSDMEKYFWDIMPSRENIIRTLKMIQGGLASVTNEELKADITTEDILSRPSVDAYKQAVENLHNSGENEEKISEYRNAVTELLGLKEIQPSTNAL